MTYFRYRVSSAGILPLTFSLPGDTFLADFISIAWAAAGRASRHLDFPSDPIYFGVVLLQPRVSWDQLLFA